MKKTDKDNVIVHLVQGEPRDGNHSHERQTVLVKWWGIYLGVLWKCQWKPEEDVYQGGVKVIEEKTDRDAWSF